MGNEQSQTAQEGRLAGRMAKLSDQGQTWQVAHKDIQFRRPEPMLSTPLEITRAMLRGLRMVDETVVVHDGAQEEESR